MTDPITTPPSAENRIGWQSAGGAAMRGNAAIVPQDWTAISLEEYQLKPNRQRRSVKTKIAATFIDYIKRHSTNQTEIFADEDAGCIRAEIDGACRDDGPGWGDHRVIFTPRHSNEWRPWRGLLTVGRPIAQRDFCEFLEEHAVHCTAPKPAEIMDFVMNFDLSRKISFKNNVRLSDGTRQLEFTEQDETKGAIKAPSEIIISVPIFDDGPEITVGIRLRYRFNEGALTFGLKCDRLADLERDQFRAQQTLIANALKALPFFAGVGALS